MLLSIKYHIVGKLDLWQITMFKPRSMKSLQVTARIYLLGPKLFGIKISTKRFLTTLVWPTTFTCLPLIK